MPISTIRSCPTICVVLMRAHEAGVDRVISIGVKLSTVDRPRAIAEAHDNVWLSVGVHPHEASNEDLACDGQLELLINQNVAIGEAGLITIMILRRATARLTAFGHRSLPHVNLIFPLLSMHAGGR